LEYIEGIINFLEGGAGEDSLNENYHIKIKNQKDKKSSAFLFEMFRNISTLAKSVRLATSNSFNFSAKNEVQVAKTAAKPTGKKDVTQYVEG